MEKALDSLEPDVVMEHSAGPVEVFYTGTNLVLLRFSDTGEVPDEGSWENRNRTWSESLERFSESWEDYMYALVERPNGKEENS